MPDGNVKYLKAVGQTVEKDESGNLSIHLPTNDAKKVTTEQTVIIAIGLDETNLNGRPYSIIAPGKSWRRG